MSRRAAVIVISACILSSAIGCHTMRFDVASGPASEIVYERKSYYLGGLFPTRNIDVRDHCAHGAIAIREQTTFLDGFLNVITLGIWAPRSSWYHCAAEEA